MDSTFMTSCVASCVVFDGFMGAFPPDNTSVARKAPEKTHLQVIPDLNLGYSGSTGQDHAWLGSDHNTPRSSSGYRYPLDLPTFTNIVPSSSSCLVDDVPSFVVVERQAPLVLYRPPERTNSGRRRYQRASAINIEGTLIDKEDLYTSAGQGDGMISVHECQWAISTNPCGMWIIGTRSHVSAHVRKWHSPRHTAKTAGCLWGGCTTRKAMLRDSLNRHILTVHLREGFHCHGCNQTFSRKDVYDTHVGSDEVCKHAGVAIVYSTERRMIDTRRALQRAGDAVRYTGC
ncbi:hypothetical protein V8E55_009255 [Tylopilus felleus]